MPPQRVYHTAVAIVFLHGCPPINLKRVCAPDRAICFFEGTPRFIVQIALRRFLKGVKYVEYLALPLIFILSSAILN